MSNNKASPPTPACPCEAEGGCSEAEKSLLKSCVGLIEKLDTSACEVLSAVVAELQGI